MALATAGVAQLEERELPKLEVTGSRPVARFRMANWRNPSGWKLMFPGVRQPLLYVSHRLGR